MKKLAFVVAAASLFAVAPVASRLGAVGSSVALVWLGVLLALFASGTVQSLSVASGALGAFASGVLGPISPAAAGAVLVSAAFAERTTRVRTRNVRAVHVLLSLATGALAGSLSTGFHTASLPVFAVAVVVAAVLSALPLLVEADDPVAHALDQAARDVSEPAKRTLREGAELRRSAEDVPLDRATQKRVTRTWQSLLRLAEARVRLERTCPPVLVRVDASPVGAGAEAAPPSPAPAPTATTSGAVVAMLDQRIAEHVAVLTKTVIAVDTARAAALGLDDAALKNVETMGDSLDAVSRAMVEVRADDLAPSSASAEEIAPGACDPDAHDAPRVVATT